MTEFWFALSLILFLVLVFMFIFDITNVIITPTISMFVGCFLLMGIFKVGSNGESPKIVQLQDIYGDNTKDYCITIYSDSEYKYTYDGICVVITPDNNVNLLSTHVSSKIDDTTTINVKCGDLSRTLTLVPVQNNITFEKVTHYRVDNFTVIGKLANSNEFIRMINDVKTMKIVFDNSRIYSFNINGLKSKYNRIMKTSMNSFRRY